MLLHVLCKLLRTTDITYDRSTGYLRAGNTRYMSISLVAMVNYRYLDDLITIDFIWHEFRGLTIAQVQALRH